MILFQQQIFFILVLSGCASIEVPNYIQDKNPYKQKYYADFEKVLKITVQTLDDFGWKVGETTKPSIYERTEMDQRENKQVLLFTRTRETSFFLGSRFAKMNVYVRSGDENVSEVEIRVITVNSIGFKKFTSYKKDSAIKRIFEDIQRRLNNKQL